MHSELQKKFDDSQSRVRELELQLVLEESKVSAAESAAVRLREEMEKKVQAAQEAESQARVEEAFLTGKVAQLNSELEKMLGRAEAAEALVVASEKEMEGVAEEALYLAWCHNRCIDLFFMEEPSMLARFETKLAAEESATAQAQLAVSEGRVPEVDPIVVMEVEVPSDTSKAPEV